MARDGAGAYTLPLSAVVTATTITPTWANTTADDMAVELTDSLDRYGRGGMTSAFENLDGTESLPGITFNGDPASGYRRSATNEMRAVVGTNDVARWRDDTGTGAGSQRPFQVWDGSAWIDPLNPASPGSITFNAIVASEASTIGNTATVTAGGLSVGADGFAVTGDSDVTGDLTVTGQLMPWGRADPTAAFDGFAMAVVSSAGTALAKQNVNLATRLGTGKYRVDFAGTFEGGPGEGYATVCGFSETGTGDGIMCEAEQGAGAFQIEVYTRDIVTGALADKGFVIMGVIV